MTKFFVDGSGKYLGGFDGVGALALVPRGATEVPEPPEDARQIWDGQAWGAKPEPIPDQSEIVDALFDKATAAPGQQAAVDARIADIKRRRENRQ